MYLLTFIPAPLYDISTLTWWKGGISTTQNKILTVPQAAKHLQVSERTIYSWLRDRKIPGRKIGKVWRISEDAIVDFLRGGQDDGRVSAPFNGTHNGHQASTAVHKQSKTANR